MLGIAMQEIIFSIDTAHHTGLITLNRPAALNALNLSMVNALHEQLSEWEKNPHILAVIIQSSSPRAFCAGGDIREVYDNYHHKKNITHYFKSEYTLNTLIKNYTKPYIALLDGLTMGGGAGISLHGKITIASDHFRFAMPETGIGFFPDVGSSFFLSRLPYHMGIYLGLTGAVLNAEEALYLKLITHKSHDFTQENHLNYYQDIINSCFKFKSIPDIINALDTQKNNFCTDILALLKTKSPTSLDLTLQLLNQAPSLDFEACIDLEYQLACQCAESEDFQEGIRAAVIDKDKNPQWKDHLKK